MYECSASFYGKPANFTITSVIGHIYGYGSASSFQVSVTSLMSNANGRCDFTPEYQNWDQTDPATLFAAPTKKEESNAKASTTSALIPSLLF